MAGCGDGVGEEEVAKGGEVDEGRMHSCWYCCGIGELVSYLVEKGLMFFER